MKNNFNKKVRDYIKEIYYKYESCLCKKYNPILIHNNMNVLFLKLLNDSEIAYSGNNLVKKFVCTRSIISMFRYQMYVDYYMNLNLKQKLDILTDDSNDDDEVSEDENNTTETEDESIDESEEVVNDEKVENEVSKDNDKKRDNMTLLTDKELLTDANRDKEFTAEFIDAGIETVKHCFQCGTCGGSCPSGRRTPYKVRQIVRKCLLGLKEEVISDDALWMCTTCYTCQERCPRSVKIVEIIKKARNVAAHAGYMALAHKKTGLFVIKTGHGVPINDATKALRSKIGLSELPATTHSFPEALEEVQKICEITAFDELIGYDKATGDLKE